MGRIGMESPPTHGAETDPTIGSSNPEPSVEKLTGTLAGEYVIEDLIARGGCGSVYFASHRTTRCRAAVKVLHRQLASSRKMVERFVREVEVVNLLRHPNIVEIYELGQLPDNRPFYVMEYLGGKTLDALQRAQGRFSPAEALEILEPVCSALSAAHAAGIIHRDVKARNIAIGEDGRRTIKLLDFGVAKLTNPTISSGGFTSVGRQIGTLSVMAPEQIRGDAIDERIDIYALGVLLHMLLTGKHPFFSVDPCELARQHIEEPPPPPSRLAAVGPAMDALVLRCLEKLPEHRFASVQSFLDALRGAAGRAGEILREEAAGATTAAVAMYLELSMDTPADDIDDALADDLGRVLDMAEARLRGAGFSLALSTGSALLGVRVLPEAPEEARRVREDAIFLAARLYEEVANREDADARIRASICVHADRATLQAPAKTDIVGGPLARTSAWAPHASARGAFATLQAIEGLPGFEATPREGRHVMIDRRPSHLSGA